MALASSRASQPRLLPLGVEKTLKGAAIRLAGCLAILMSLASWACLLTWSFGDPGLNDTPHHSVNNILGIFGAAWADLIMQLFGLAAIFLTLPLAGWGWHISKRSLPTLMPLRALFWPLAGALLTTAFALTPLTVNWPLPHGLGGIFGDFFAKQIDTGTIASYAICIMAFLTGIIAILFASGIRIFSLLSLWQVDLRFFGHVLLLIFWPFIRNFADWIATISFRPKNERFFEWRSIIAKMEKEEVDAFPSYERQVTPPPIFDQTDNRIEPHFGQSSSAPDDIDDREIDYKSPYDVPSRSRGKKDAKRPNATREKSAEPFRLPHLRLLKKSQNRSRKTAFAVDTLAQNARDLEGILQDFGVKGEVVRAHPGPVVTLYELEPARGVKSSRIIGLADDIARSMSAISARVAVIPGRNAIGIELPNDTREMVYLRDMFEQQAFHATNAKLPLVLGKDIAGDPVIADLTRMPHLLIAGTTGSGKSVGINTMITSLLYRLSPQECKLILIDPKMLELSVYEGIPHLLTPVVTDPHKAIAALKWTIREMEERYRRMSKLGVRNITGFNQKVLENAGQSGVFSRMVQTGFDPDTKRPIYETENIELEPMPFIVVVIDEMADLMMVAGKDIEAAVQRLAQMARAAGIHLITATQRPSVDVITGTIKANFPTRISFKVTSKVDSRTILAEQGAEQLLGDGDMLYMSGGGNITRVHGPFVSDDEIEKIVNYLKSQATPDYLEDVTQDQEQTSEDSETKNASSGDELYDRAVAIVLRDNKVSTSYVQRRLSIGYNKAAMIIERMEEEGLISAANHAGKRQILVDTD